MPQTRTKPGDKSKGGNSKKSSAAKSARELPDVLTLTEAAAYLRVSEEDVERSVAQQGLPGRRIGSEWRFLKAALEVWLGIVPKAGGKETLLHMAGVFKDDPFLEEIVRDAYEKRGRPITEKAG